MNSTQAGITIGYGILVIACCVILAFLLRSTRAHRRIDKLTAKKLAGMEGAWGVACAVVLLVLLGLTITQVPYGKADADPAAKQVSVTSQQFGWDIRPSMIPAGKPVEFSLRSRDVQHGFGVYDGTKLIFQVQVPAKESGVQTYRHTFEKPGTYDVLCMEFCGYQHYAMRGSFKVVG